MAYKKTGIQLQKDITKKLLESKTKTSKKPKLKRKEKTSEANVIDSAIETSTGRDINELSFNDLSELDKDKSATVSQDDLAALGITNLVGGEASIGEVKKILEKRPLVPALQASVFNLNYQIEPAPIPAINNLYSLQTKRADIFNKLYKH